jgi:hypothetical protein
LETWILETRIVVFARRPKSAAPTTRPGNSLAILAKSWKPLASKCRIGDAMWRRNAQPPDRSTPFRSAVVPDAPRHAWNQFSPEIVILP